MSDVRRSRVPPRWPSSSRPRSPRSGSGRPPSTSTAPSARSRRAEAGVDARTVRGGPAGSPRPLGHRGRGPARRREPRAGRGAARRAVPATRAGWWHAPASARRCSWCATPAGRWPAGRRAHAARRGRCVGRARPTRAFSPAARLHVHVEGRGAAARPAVRRARPCRLTASLPCGAPTGLWCPDWPIVAARVARRARGDRGTDESPPDRRRAGSSRDRGSGGAGRVGRSASGRSDARAAPA